MARTHGMCVSVDEMNGKKVWRHRPTEDWRQNINTYLVRKISFPSSNCIILRDLWKSHHFSRARALRLHRYTYRNHTRTSTFCREGNCFLSLQELRRCNSMQLVQYILKDKIWKSLRGAWCKNLASFVSSRVEICSRFATTCSTEKCFNIV